MDDSGYHTPYSNPSLRFGRYGADYPLWRSVELLKNFHDVLGLVPLVEGISVDVFLTHSEVNIAKDITMSRTY